MAAEQSIKSDSIENEPVIVKSYSFNSDKLIKEGVSSGQVEEFVLIPGIEIGQMCKFGTDVIFVYRSKSDKEKGGVVMFDPITKKIKQHIETLAVWRCAYDNSYLVVGGIANGMIYIFQYLTNEFKLMKSTQLHESESTVYGVAVSMSINKIVSVCSEGEAIISNLLGDVLSRNQFRICPRCIVINNEFSAAFVGCDFAMLVAIDLIDLSVKATTKAGCDSIYCSAILGNILVTGDSDSWIQAFKIEPVSPSSSSSSSSFKLTKTWRYMCQGDGFCSLYLYSSHVFVNAYLDNTIMLDVNTGQVEKEYSETASSHGLVVIGSQDEATNEASPTAHNPLILLDDELATAATSTSVPNPLILLEDLTISSPQNPLNLLDENQLNQEIGGVRTADPPLAVNPDNLPVSSNADLPTRPQQAPFPVSSWSVQDVKNWMAEKELHPNIQSELTGFTGAELIMFSDPEVFDELKLTKPQAHRLTTVLSEIGIVVKRK